MVNEMSPDEIVNRYPQLYHMAADGSWESIKSHGLLSTSALLDLFEIRDPQREQLYSKHRPESVSIQHSQFGTAIIRDQKPMSEGGLLRCLRDGLTPRDWYEILNRRVFFWLTENRLKRMLTAKAYKNEEHIVLTIDTSRLMNQYESSISLSPMNSGCTKPFPWPRGRSTFLRLRDYPFDDWVKRRRINNDPVVELAVDQGVPNVSALTVRVQRRRALDTIETIWERDSP